MASAKNSKRNGAFSLSESVRFEPAFTKEKAIDLSQDRFGMERRMTFLTLARRGSELSDWVSYEGNHDAYFALLESIQNYQEHLKAGIDICDSALARLLLVGEFEAEREKNKAKEKTEEVAA